MGTTSRLSGVLLALALAGCTTTASSDRETPPSPTPTPQARVTEEADGLGIVIRPSRVVLRDGPGDVWRLLPLPAGRDDAPIDVRRAVVVHGADAVRVRLDLVDLRATGRQLYDVGLTTARGRGYVVVASEPDDRAGRLLGLVDAQGGTVGCPALTWDLDYDADTVEVRVPRSCLGDPEWVSVRVLVSLRIAGRAYAENPHNHRAFSEFSTERLFPPF